MRRLVFAVLVFVISACGGSVTVEECDDAGTQPPHHHRHHDDDDDLRGLKPQAKPRPKPDAGVVDAGVVDTLRTATCRADGCWATSFPSTTYNIYFAFDAPDKVGTTAQLEIFAPGNLPYVSYTSTVGADGRAWFSLPVAGTTITQYQLYGTWTADVPGVVGTTFGITP